jgi:hypothetical protein
MASNLVSFVQKKLVVAQCLDNGGCGGGYGEAVLVVAGLLGGISADLWPGKRIDRPRFVELWSQYADPTHGPNRISLPLLVARLRETGRDAEAAALETFRPHVFGPGYHSRIVTADDVDLTEAEILGLCPTLAVVDVRASSYGAVFYEHVRSAIVHEFHFGTQAVGVPMTDRQADVSYSNYLDRHTRAHSRRIHFHMPWLVSLADSVAANADPVLPSAPLPNPSPWWINGR